MMNLTIDEVLNLDAVAMRITGSSCTGKTELLCRMAVKHVEDGAGESDALLVTAAGNAAAEARIRLNALGPVGAKVRVTTPIQLALQVLSHPDAEALTGRPARLATRLEYTLILRDLLLATGADPKAVRNATNRLFTSWRKGNLLPDADPVAQVLTDLLRTYGVILEQELMPLACHALERQPRIVETLGTAGLVLVDDAQDLSAASLMLCRLLSADRLVVAGDPDAAVSGLDDGADGSAFTNLADAIPGMADVALADPNVANPRISSLQKALVSKDGSVFDEMLANGAFGLDDDHVQMVKWRRAQDEQSSAGRIIRSLVESEDELEPGQICVVVPDREWARKAADDLYHHRFDTTIALDDDPLSGDPRVLDRCPMPLSFARLALLADGDDALAWRLWCGLGSRNLMDREWAALTTWAKQQGVTTVQALLRLADGAVIDFPEAEALRPRVAEGLALIKASATKTGLSLLRACSPDDNPDFLNLVGRVSGAEGAAVLMARVRVNCHSQVHDPDPTKVRICGLRGLVGLNPRVVLVLGAVDGLIPSAACLDERLPEAARKLALDEQGRRFALAAGHARQRLIISCFQKVPAAEAQRMGLVVRRYKMEKGERLAMVSPSAFIGWAGDAAPGFVSGEQFL